MSKKLEIKKILNILYPGSEQMNDAKAEEYVMIGFFKVVLQEINKQGAMANLWLKPNSGERRIFINDQALNRDQKIFLSWNEEEKNFTMDSRGSVEAKILDKWKKGNKQEYFPR